jgi:Mrp family chromosome partitioning ATPase
MEKLQAALEQARARRGDPAAPSYPAETRDTDRRPQERRSASTSVAERWEALASIDLKPNWLKKNRVFSRGEKSVDAASFDVLRTKVLLQMEKNGWSRLAVTSAASGAGKSTVCCNLASSISRQKTIRAILMDLDLRRPALASILGVDTKGTAADVLSGSTPFAEQARRLGPNVALSLNSGPVKDPSDVFLNPQTSEIVSRIERDYKPNLMIFDVPPLFVNDDAAAFLTNVDCVLIVADAGRTTISEVDRCEKEVAEHANVLGIVLNKCTFTEDSSYGYGYGEGY